MTPVKPVSTDTTGKPAKWRCTEPDCDATGEQPSKKAATKEFERHWYFTHRERP